MQRLACADGDQIVGILALGIVLFDDVRHKAQIVLDQFIARVDISLLPTGKTIRLLLAAERFGKGIARHDAQHEKQTVHQQPECAFDHCAITSLHPIPARPVSIPEKLTEKEKRGGKRRKRRKTCLFRKSVV